MSRIIEIKNLKKFYGEGQNKINVLKDISMDINEGEFVSIMGASGSGKSTLLYLIGALENVDGGSIKLCDEAVEKMNDKKASVVRRKKIGFIFQFYNLIPNLTVEENIMVPILLEGKKQKDYQKKVSLLLQTVGLSDKKNNLPSELSGGQQQRVAIARALINDPDIILADEPIGNLDSKTGKEIMELLAGINKKQHKTIVQVTHSKEAALHGNRLITLKDGEIVGDEFVS